MPWRGVVTVALVNKLWKHVTRVDSEFNSNELGHVLIQHGLAGASSGEPSSYLSITVR